MSTGLDYRDDVLGRCSGPIKESISMSELDSSLCEGDGVLELLESTDDDESEEQSSPACNRRHDKIIKQSIYTTNPE